MCMRKLALSRLFVKAVTFYICITLLNLFPCKLISRRLVNKIFRVYHIINRFNFLISQEKTIDSFSAIYIITSSSEPNCNVSKLGELSTISNSYYFNYSKLLI